jgi:GNAT superfamily N-acetyltransferase
MGESWQVERRGAGDPAVEAMVAEYFDELRVVMPGYDPTRAAPPSVEDFTWPQGTFVLISEGDEPLACGALRRLSERTGELRRMYVKPKWRSRGAGRFLLQALEEVATEMGLGELCLDTNLVLRAAQGLYRSSGYVDVSPYNDNDFADCWMKKVLPPPP